MSSSLCQFWSNNSILLQILHSSSVSWKITPLYVFSSNNIYFAQKEPIKVKMFDTLEYSGQNLSNYLCQFWNDKLISLQTLHLFLVSWKITPLDVFSSNNIDNTKRKFLRLSSGRSKFVKFLISILKLQFCQFLFNLCIILHCHNTNPLRILRSYLFYFVLKGSHQSPNFEIFKGSGEKALQILHHPSMS